MGPNPFDWCPYEKGEMWIQTCTQGEHHMETKAEITVMRPQGKGRPRLPANH